MAHETAPFDYSDGDGPISALAADKKPLMDDPIVERAVRKQLKKPEGELTKADLEKLTDTGQMDRLSIFDFLLPPLPES